jgi:hypothetical protein
MIAIQAAESSVPPEAGAERYAEAHRHLRRRLCRLSLSGKIRRGAQASVETIMLPVAERKDTPRRTGICGDDYAA